MKLKRSSKKRIARGVVGKTRAIHAMLKRDRRRR